ncbi:MAG: hypothetical protein WA797_04605 [Acidimicrobiales bacterium]
MRGSASFRKGLDALQREVGRAPEQRAARGLGAVPVGAGPKVLFLTPRSWAAHVQWEAMVGRALAERGARVSYLTCGGDRPICDRVHVYEGPPMPCRSCTSYVHRSLDAHGHRWESLRGLGHVEHRWPELDEMGLQDLRDATWNGLPLGRLVQVPVGWYLCNTDLESDPLGCVTYRRFLRSAAAISDEIEVAILRESPDTVVMLNGLFLFEQVARELCERAGIDVVTYERGYIKDTVFFHRGVSASRYETTALWEQERGRPLTSAEDQELDVYLGDRQRGAQSISDFWPAPRFDEPEPGFSVLFTNVTWDTAVQDRDRCFLNPREWLVETVRWFEQHPQHRLIVRAHPAEVRTPGARSREPVVDVLTRAIPSLPDNVVVLAPDDPTSSYPLMKGADVALVYTSTAGMEAVLSGTPCITAGDTQYGGKGFTLDPPDRAAYFEILERAVRSPETMSVDRESARRYAHFFFFRAALSSRGWMEEPIAGLARIPGDSRVLKPGGDSDLDVICRGILDRMSFMRPRHDDVTAAD